MSDRFETQYHVLICGSRDYKDQEAIAHELEGIAPALAPAAICVITGGVKGADNLAKDLAQSLGYTTATYPADWKKHGKAAGPIRNQEMLDCEPNIDECWAFSDHLLDSKGTLDMLRRVTQQRPHCRIKVIGRSFG
jgi:hypothetical protein